MTNADIRWVQRFDNYQKALNQLKKAVEISSQRDLNDLEQQGVVQAFEYTHELAWKTLKDFLEYKGNEGIYGSRDATRVSFKLGIVENGEVWMDMIKSRNQSSHTYNEETATKVVNDILKSYYKEFIALEEKLKTLK
ncbi:MAG: nucleotidyltransferase substrate binding protein [Bacteroidales bacterium]|nr:nucleotidyltransferase substrate binding protein [Bacteroidales bacterium]